MDIVTSCDYGFNHNWNPLSKYTSHTINTYSDTKCGWWMGNENNTGTSMTSTIPQSKILSSTIRK